MARRKVRNHIPGIITFINLFLGFIAVTNIMEGYYEFACHCIILGAVLDSIDGKLARLFGIASSFGAEIDSLADLISFCLVPSIFIYVLYTSNFPGISGEIIASLPLILGAIRLARFNTEAINNTSKSYFKGLPTPANALAIISVILFVQQNSIYSDPKLLLPIIILISFMMVTKVRYEKFPILNFKSGLQNSFKIIILFSFIIFFVIAYFYNQESWVLMGFTGFYILSGILTHVLFQNKRMKIIGEN